MSSMITFAGENQTLAIQAHAGTVFAQFVTSDGRGGEQGESKALEDSGTVIYGHYGDNSDY